jgi:hypothetical protein
MERLSIFAFAACLSLGGLFAQTSDIIVFSDAGEKFTLLIDGEVKNASPAARVVAQGIKNATPMLVVDFADARIPSIRQNGYLEPGLEYTLRITMNKKGVRVLRPQGRAPLGTTSAASADASAPARFTEDAPTGTDQQTVATDYNGMQSTTTVTTTNGVAGQNANVDLGMNGMNVSMSVNGMDGNTSTTTTTTTTTTTSIPAETNEATAAPEAVVTASTSGCAQAMGTSDFADAVTSIKSKGFEETKLTLAKQIGGSNCFTTAQVKTIMGLFGFEDSKLDFAKFAYGHTVDVNNYFKVNDAFGFSSSVDELNKYIQGH